jgi:hypothetical protein
VKVTNSFGQFRVSKTFFGRHEDESSYSIAIMKWKLGCLNFDGTKHLQLHYPIFFGKMCNHYAGLCAKTSSTQSKRALDNCDEKVGS